MELFARTQLGYWQKGVLNYNVYMVLAIVLGFFAIDHLYLRSPMSFLAKLFINVITLGFLWLYDAIQAVFNRDEVKLYGVNFPLVPPVGIGAGMFTGLPSNLSESEKGYANNFLWYGLVLFFTGVFGGDSFLLGDRMSGWIRLLACLSFIGLPLAIIWYLFKLFEFFFRTGNLLDMNWEYFDAPKPAHLPPKCPNVLEQLTVYAFETASVFADKIPVIREFKPWLDDTVEALKVAYGMVSTVVVEAAKTAKAVSEAGPVLEGALSATTDIDKGAFAEAVAKERGVGTAAPVVAEGTTEIPVSASAPSTVAPQSGGTRSPPSSLMTAGVLGTILAVIVSGFGVSLRRVMQNGPQQGSQIPNDTPPQPGTI